jgi:Vps52, C-terminal
MPVFRSLNLYLLDMVTSEYLFDVEFFGKVDLFTPILGKVTQLFVGNLRDYLSSCFDCVGILLVIRVARGFLNMANQRQVSGLCSPVSRTLEPSAPLHLSLLVLSSSGDLLRLLSLLVVGFVCRSLLVSLLRLRLQSFSRTLSPVPSFCGRGSPRCSRCTWRA